MKKLFTENRNNLWFWLFIGVAAVLFFVMPIMSKDAGNSGDEDGFQIPQGYNVLNYYKTDHADSTCMTFENLKYYGCSFDVITAWINETFHVESISTTRHIANAFLGWVVVLFVGLIAYRLGGWRAGVMAMLLMFLSPRFLGHSFNNPKDIPLAAGVIMSIYYIMMFFRQASEAGRKLPKWSTMIMLVLSLALAISIRIGGLIIIGYFGLWGLLWAISLRQKNDNQKKADYDWNRFFRALGLAIAICIIGFFVGILLWPYAMQSPIKNSIDSYHAMSKFAIAIRQIYNGQMVWSDALPWYYTPKFIFTTIPVAVILGWLIYPVFGAFGRKEGKLRQIENIMIYFCFIFPVAWIVYTKANVYGGWRHSLFAYPPMVAAAGLGFDALLKKLTFKKGEEEQPTKRSPILSIVAYVAIALTLVGPVRHLCANHPYEYIYFNELAGGTKKAFGQYEMDYYYHSMREATEWVIKNGKPSDLQTGDKILVGTWHTNSTKYFLRNDTTQFKHTFIRWYQRGDKDWDYAVFPLTGIDPDYLRSSKVFPPKDMVHQITVDGVPVAIVLQRHDKNDYYGTKYKEEKKYDSAMMCYRKALAYNPYNEAVLLDMAEIYLGSQMADSCILMCQRFFEFEPNNDNANFYYANALLQKKDVNKCIEVCNNIKKHNFKYTNAYQLLMQIYLQQNNLVAAEQEILQLIDIDQLDNQMVQVYVSIQKAKGLDERTSYKGLYSTIARSLERRGKKQEAETYLNYAKNM
ncbi:MAG: phospholipid carrier-dependent glycosyltransferase [Bacteroidales bacterium]|nr:phospholipid carrier-dependent glycosyltransferase [Bacteroidales bacterium]